MVEVDISIIFAGLSIAASIVYYASVIRNQNKTQQMQLETRKTQLFMQLYERISDRETMKAWAELVNNPAQDYDEFIQKYDSTVNPDHYAKRAHIWFISNTIGELLREGQINIDLAYRLQLSPLVVVMWETWEHIIKEIRERENAPELSEGFEYLYHELKKYRKEKGYSEYRYPREK